MVQLIRPSPLDCAVDNTIVLCTWYSAHGHMAVTQSQIAASCFAARAFGCGLHCPICAGINAQKSSVKAICCLANRNYGASAQEAEADLASAAVGQRAGNT